MEEKPKKLGELKPGELEDLRKKLWELSQRVEPVLKEESKTIARMARTLEPERIKPLRQCWKLRGLIDTARDLVHALEAYRVALVELEELGKPEEVSREHWRLVRSVLRKLSEKTDAFEREFVGKQM